jgi:hypothetical protein
MAVVMRATCSECYQTMDLLIGEAQKEIVCPVCGHAVPALESKVMQALSKDQAKRRLFAAVSVVFFLAAVGLFIFFTVKAEPVAGSEEIPSQAKAMLGGALIMLLASIGVGYVASNRSYVCEF